MESWRESWRVACTRAHKLTDWDNLWGYYQHCLEIDQLLSSYQLALSGEHGKAHRTSSPDAHKGRGLLSYQPSFSAETFQGAISSITGQGSLIFVEAQASLSPVTDQPQVTPRRAEGDCQKLSACDSVCGTRPVGVDGGSI